MLYLRPVFNPSVSIFLKQIALYGKTNKQAKVLYNITHLQCVFMFRIQRKGDCKVHSLWSLYVRLHDINSNNNYWNWRHYHEL